MKTFLKYIFRIPFLNILAIITLILLPSKKIFAQQDPMYTQYNFNTQTINPAYAGTWKTFGFTVLGRYQWLGVNNSPHTYTLSIQTPTKKEKVGLGLNIVSDQLGQEQHLSIMADYSYQVQLDINTYLRWGLKAGIVHYSNPLSKYIQDDDPTQQEVFENIDSKLVPNFGFGFFIYNPDFYISFSVPKILETKFEASTSNTNYSNYAEVRHFYLQGAYVFPIGSFVKFKPSLLAKAAIGSPISIDVTGNFLLADKFWIGAMARTSKSFGFLTQWITSKNLRLGYSVDFNLSKSSPLGETHELMISYEINSRARYKIPSLF